MARDEAYRIAEQKIGRALRFETTELDLSAIELTELPESVGQLSQLQWLSLSDNELTELPESLGQLTQLHELHLDNNQLTTSPESLGQLMRLQVLFLDDNELTVLPEPICQLTQLQILSLSSNQLTTLPEWLGQLSQLRTLYLHNNRLRALPELLGQLKQLKELSLDNNQLVRLPESLGHLTQLRALYLHNNQLMSLPKSLGQLSQLQKLHLHNNRLTALPHSLKRLKALEELFLHDNPKLQLSPKILGPTWDEGFGPDYKRVADPRAILAFYFSQRDLSAKPLHEVKLLLVGHGRVGKTSLSKALRGAPHDEREPETPGIERHPLSLKVGKATITAHVWDFGGQEFLHQTHQFFFSERSIYVVVLSGRQGRPMQEAEYWLRLIRTYGAGSPVIIALNQIEAHPFTVDEYFLQEKYPEVKAVVRTDCDPHTGIAELRKQLGKIASEMPSVRAKIDPAWARVRKHLEEMKQSFVTFAHYRAICAEMGVTGAEQQETLATILDCLGIALNYRDDPRLRDTSVLKPRWLVDGIYTVLRWLHKHETNGALRLEDFPKALKSKRTYPPDMHGFLLALMEKFELCFPVESKEGVYLVPGLLDANQPRELRQFTNGKAQRIQFRYEDVRPPGLLPRFIVRSHTLSEGQPRWLRGVVLARGQARALVRGDHEGRVTDIFVQGGQADDRVWLAEFILAEMRVLNDKLPVRTLVESEASPGAWTDLEVLREAAQRNEETRTERAADGGTVTVPVKETLREVESPEASAPKDSPLPLFICYAHANERHVKQLIPSLKVLARRGYILPWRDTDLVPGEDWDETIKERLAGAKVVLFMVSRDFLASEYITKHERPFAMQMMNDKQAAVVPVILSPCDWQEEDFAKLENLPHKGKPVSSFNPRDEAWTLVETGLKKAVEQARQFSKISDASHRPMMKR
jgi:internalin A